MMMMIMTVRGKSDAENDKQYFLETCRKRGPQFNNQTATMRNYILDFEPKRRLERDDILDESVILPSLTYPLDLGFRL